MCRCGYVLSSGNRLMNGFITSTISNWIGTICPWPCNKFREHQQHQISFLLLHRPIIPISTRISMPIASITRPHPCSPPVAITAPLWIWSVRNISAGWSAFTSVSITTLWARFGPLRCLTSSHSSSNTSNKKTNFLPSKLLRWLNESFFYWCMELLDLNWNFISAWLQLLLLTSCGDRWAKWRRTESSRVDYTSNCRPCPMILTTHSILTDPKDIGESIAKAPVKVFSSVSSHWLPGLLCSSSSSLWR